MKVIFRKYKEGDIIALFPQEPGSASNPYDCVCYQHIGQHGSADLQGVVASTKPAQPDEYDDLLNELVYIGYDDLQVSKRASANDSAIRYQKWNRQGVPA